MRIRTFNCGVIMVFCGVPYLAHAGPRAWSSSLDRTPGTISEWVSPTLVGEDVADRVPADPVIEPVPLAVQEGTRNPAEGAAPVVAGICNPLSPCEDPDCSTATKCTFGCFGNPLCATQCGGNSCNIGCSPCATGCSNECSDVVCPQNICTRSRCSPECNILCINQYDPCACYGSCNVLCDPDAFLCNPGCGGNACNSPTCLGYDLCTCSPCVCDPCASGCSPECNPICSQFDACECAGLDRCNPTCNPTGAVCDPTCNPPIAPSCNPLCGGDACGPTCAPQCNPLCGGGDACGPGCLDRCDDVLCVVSAQCDPACDPPVAPACNQLCFEAYDPCACAGLDRCNPICNPTGAVCDPTCNPIIAPECNLGCAAFDLCQCAPGPCNRACPEFDVCGCAPSVCNPACHSFDPCACAPGVCNPACPDFDYCACANVDPGAFDPCLCDPCGPTCKSECNPFCGHFDLCACEPCACNPCGPTCKPECNPICEQFDTCACSPGPCNPLCDGFDKCECDPCLPDPHGGYLCPAAQDNPCLCSPCAQGCPGRCSSLACSSVCYEDCPQYDRCACEGPCSFSLECFDFCGCYPCVCEPCSQACQEQDPCARAGCDGFDLCQCSPCGCDPNASTPGYDLCLCEPCRAECHPECNPTCDQFDPCLCSNGDPCACDPCGPTCFPECNPKCDAFDFKTCADTAICNPVYGGDAVCNPVCGGDPCNSIHCPGFTPLCRIVSIVDCLSGPKTLPVAPDSATPIDCLRVFDKGGDGDVDLDDLGKYLNSLSLP